MDKVLRRFRIGTQQIVIVSDLYEMPVTQLTLSTRVLNCLRRAGVFTVRDILSKRENELMAMRNLGQTSLRELQTCLGALGLSLALEEKGDKDETSKEAISKQSDVPSQSEEVVYNETHEDKQAVLPGFTTYRSFQDSLIVSPERQLELLFSSLKQRERTILASRFGLTNGQTLTLAQVGEKFGLSRERIRQIEEKALRKLRHPTRRELAQHLLESSTDGLSHLLYSVVTYVSLPHAANFTGSSTDALMQLVEAGKLTAVKKPSGQIFFKVAELRSIRRSQKQISTQPSPDATVASPRRCFVCGSIVPRGRISYCSKECANKRWSYANWSEERKAKHSEAVRAWQYKHPEELRIIQKRASLKYQWKKARLRRFDKMSEEIAELKDY